MGVLFLLATMGILEIHSLGRLFARFWPALLILWGVLKLIEYEQAKRSGQPARGIGVGGVFLMLFLIGAGLIATQAARLNWKIIGEHIQIGDWDAAEVFGGSTFNYSDELSQEIPAGGTLHVNDDRGTITIDRMDGARERSLRYALFLRDATSPQRRAAQLLHRRRQAVEQRRGFLQRGSLRHCPGER